MQVVLPHFETGAATHVGKVREKNEDRYLVRPEVGIWMVADGMGGHLAGEIASSMVTEALQSVGPATSAAELLAQCEEHIIEANRKLREIGRQRGGIVIGTTVAALLVFETHYACVWSGDSRIYLVRNGEIQQISRDHTEVEELVAEGILNRAEAKNWPRSNVVTRAIGVHDNPELEMRNGVLEPGDTFLICSDGLTAHVKDREILACLVAGAAQEACDKLVELTLQRGATDNVTVVAAHYHFDDGKTVVPFARKPSDPWE